MPSAPVSDGHPRSVSYDFPDEVFHAVSTRHGGFSSAPYRSLNMGLSTGDEPHKVRANRSSFAAAHKVDLDDVLIGRLSHGVDVSVFRHEDSGAWPVHHVPRSDTGQYESVFRSDAAISNVPGLYFLLTFADCVPLLFYDPVNRAVGAAHAGWRGTSLGMAAAVVTSMQASFGSRPADMIAAIGPSIGPCCYSVRRDVIETFARNGMAASHEKRAGEYFLDLWETNATQMRRAGIPASRIQNMRLCTSCEVKNFYSHRAESGTTGRFALLSGIRPSPE